MGEVTTAGPADDGRRCVGVLGSPIDAVDWTTALARIARWAAARESRYVCICNAHSVVTASADPDFAAVVREADMATPDGAPVAWLMRRLGERAQQRINGPDLMWRYSAEAEAARSGVFLLGSTPQTLERLQQRMRDAFPALRIRGVASPPFRPPTPAEEAALVEQINGSGAGVVWVSLGCPKQEHWMARHRGRVRAVMVGVGAAFDFHAGTVARAPAWMRDHGLEWLHRLWSEPQRLWRRYLTTNSLFVVKAARQLALARRSRH